MSEQIDVDRLTHFIPFDSLSKNYLSDIVDQFELKRFSENQMIFKRNEEDDYCHYLLEGAVDLADKDFNIEKLTAVSIDNYLALDNHKIHRVSAISTDNTLIASIKREQLDLLVIWSEACESLASCALDHNIDWMEALLFSGLFSQIPPALIQQLFIKFVEEEKSLGDVIIKEGDEGNKFYVIKHGRCIVSKMVGGQKETLAALQTGNFFGQDALVGDDKRNATVTMSSNGILMSLDKEMFSNLLKEPILQFIDEAEYRHMIEEGDRGVVLVDVRTAEEASHEKIPHSKNIPLNDLRDEARKLESDFEYVVVSDGGRRSELGVYILTEAGLSASILKQEVVEEIDSGS